MALDIRRADEETTQALDLREKGRTAAGETITLDRRLFMQFLAFGECPRLQPVIDALDAAGQPGVVYADLNDPYGFGLLLFDEKPDTFLTTVRALLTSEPFTHYAPRPAYTMFGRTYTIGYEADLERTLITRPIERVTDPALPWAIWYPLRRRGSFEQLSAQEQRVILMEHGGIGQAYGRAGYGHDIRLACFGLDRHDNDFVVGLVGPELYPLSSIVERMRKTKQTSQYLERLGPFFVGKAVRQAGPGESHAAGR